MPAPRLTPLGPGGRGGSSVESLMRPWGSLVQRCYAPDEVSRALIEAGFESVSAPEADTDLGLTGHTGRTFFLARER
jgi:hypothetical protein